MGKDTHKLMLDHSQAKVKLYGNYLAKYLRVIAQDRYTTRVHLYDMFSGEGVYESGENGSPIIALFKIGNFYDEFPSNDLKIKITFNDIDKTVIEKLKENLKQAPNPQKCETRIFNENYLNLLPKLNAEIKAFRNEKAVIFLDPKGYKEISIPQISELLNNKTEVLVFLPVRDMYRFSNMKKENITSAHEPLHKFINEIFSDTVPDFDSQWDFIQKAKEGLKKILPNFYVDTFTLEREQGQLFCLFFFTSHIYGFEKMLETKWEIDTEEGRMLRYEKTGLMFSGTDTLDYPNKLKNFLRDKKSNAEVYDFSLHEGFLPKHTNDILNDLQKGGNLQVYNHDGTTAREGAFYINYQKYKEEPKKISIKYKPADVQTSLF